MNLAGSTIGPDLKVHNCDNYKFEESSGVAMLATGPPQDKNIQFPLILFGHFIKFHQLLVALFCINSHIRVSSLFMLIINLGAMVAGVNSTSRRSAIVHIEITTLLLLVILSIIILSYKIRISTHRRCVYLWILSTFGMKQCQLQQHSIATHKPLRGS